jgi:hypothetical protein
MRNRQNLKFLRLGAAAALVMAAALTPVGRVGAAEQRGLRRRSAPPSLAAWVTGRNGPEAGVWVIAETDRSADQIRQDRR